MSPTPPRSPSPSLTGSARSLEAQTPQPSLGPSTAASAVWPLRDGPQGAFWDISRNRDGFVNRRIHRWREMVSLLASPASSSPQSLMWEQSSAPRTRSPSPWRSFISNRHQLTRNTFTGRLPERLLRSRVALPPTPAVSSSNSAPLVARRLHLGPVSAHLEESRRLLMTRVRSSRDRSRLARQQLPSSSTRPSPRWNPQSFPGGDVLRNPVTAFPCSGQPFHESSLDRSILVFLCDQRR